MAEAKPEDGPVPSASAGGPASSRSRSLGFAWAAALPYAILVVAFGINAPFWDDFILFRPTESSGGASLEWLLKGHNEHRIAWSKALAECVRHTLGHLDFRVLGLVGNALLLPLAWVTLRLVGSPSFSLWLRVLAASLLFTPLSFEPLIWPTASTQAYGVLLFGAISFVLGARPGTWLLAGATCAAILATLASASGLLVLPIMGIRHIGEALAPEHLR